MYNDILKKLANLANELDKQGYLEEANKIDCLLSESQKIVQANENQKEDDDILAMEVALDELKQALYLALRNEDLALENKDKFSAKLYRNDALRLHKAISVGEKDLLAAKANQLNADDAKTKNNPNFKIGPVKIEKQPALQVGPITIDKQPTLEVGKPIFDKK